MKRVKKTPVEVEVENKITRLMGFKWLRGPFEWIGNNPNSFMFYFNVLNAAVIFTALISPWIYILWNTVVPTILFRITPLSALSNMIQMINKRTIDFSGLVISVFFMMIHYIFLFACLNMAFGTVELNGGQVISTLWEHVYFSVVTFTTLGYGNVIPASIASEVLAALEALIGFSLFAFLIGMVSAIALQASDETHSS